MVNLKKRGIELSINMLVVIILSMVLLSTGILITRSFMQQATDLSKLSLESIDKEIGILACESTDRVCIPIKNAEIEKGEFYVFGLNIINMEDSAQDFKIVIYPNNHPDTGDPLGVDKFENEIPSTGDITNPNWMYVRPAMREIKGLQVNEEKEVGIGIQVPKKGLTKGTYVFSVYIGVDKNNDGNLNCGDLFTDPCPTPIPPTPSCPADTTQFDYDCIKGLKDCNCFDRTKLYGEQVYTLYVTVP